MENTNTNWIAMSDSAIVSQIGAFIKNERLNSNRTQAQLAKEAGINKWTLGQIENGEAITLLSLIQILRALGVLPLLDIFSIKQEISPIALAKKPNKKDNVLETRITIQLKNQTGNDYNCFCKNMG